MCGHRSAPGSTSPPLRGLLCSLGLWRLSAHSRTLRMPFTLDYYSVSPGAIQTANVYG